MGNDAFTFRIADRSDAAAIGTLVRSAYADVAMRFGLTEGTCPAHNAFMADDVVLHCIDLGATFLLATERRTPCGCVSFRKVENGATMLEKLAVLPHWRHRGLGGTLMARACEMARTAGAELVEIGVIEENRRLVQWYEHLGFRTVRQSRFDHLPFDVAYMQRTAEA